MRPDETLTFAITATDPEGDPIVLKAEGLPAGSSFDPASGLFSWTPGARSTGVHYLAFVATEIHDPAIQGSKTIALTVLPDPLPDPLLDPDKAPEGILQGGTTFGQSLPARDAQGETFSGQANSWDLDGDFALLTGGDEEIFQGAMQLRIGTDRTLFPKVPYTELAWGAPYFSQADGVKTVAVSAPYVSLSGRYSALLNGTSDSRLQQDVDLSGAVPPLTLTWNDLDAPFPGNFAEEPIRYELVIRGRDGELREAIDDLPDEPMTRDLSRFAGERVEISFEARFAGPGGIVFLDDLSLRDASGREFLVNGSFETGDLRGWKSALALESQGVASPARDIGNVRVTRSFFTYPTAPWGRWVDTFENLLNTEQTFDVHYLVALGSHLGAPSQGTARIYPTPDTTEALSVWDITELMKRTGNLTEEIFGTRDVGLVFGNLEPNYVTAATLSDPAGSNEIYLTRQLRLGPREQGAIVTFVVMDTGDTGETATSLNTRAIRIDGINQAIVRDFGIPNSVYRTGLPNVPILNFP